MFLQCVQRKLDISGTDTENATFVILVDEAPIQIPTAHFNLNRTIKYQFQRWF